MKKLSFRPQCNPISFSTIIIVIFFLFGFCSCSRISQNQDLSTAVESNLLSGLPLRFVENIGQTLPEVLYHVEGAGHTILFESRRVVFNRNGERTDSYPGAQIILEFPGSSLSAKIHGTSKQNGVTNYYTGNDPSEWYTNISSYGSLIYEGLYPGINMICSGDQGTIKNEFHVAPGVDPGLIQMSYAGANKVKLSRNGDLFIRTNEGVLVDAAPVAYQMIDGETKEIKVNYRVRQGVVSFKLGAYDPGLPLIIDPEFSYVTYYSGSQETNGVGVAVDKDGYLLFAGYSRATDLPVANPVQQSNAGWEDAFVVKIDTSTGDYVYATYMGGDSSEIVRDFAIDEDGNAYITGSTISSDFPVSENAYQKTSNGYQEAFLTKLGPDGMVVYSTLLGGSNRDYSYSMTLNARQEAYLTGYAASSNFPLSNAFQTTLGGNYDVFISKFSAGGDSLLYSTFLGGTDLEGARSIALDKNENIFVTGETKSTDFPVVNENQGTLAGISDAFVSKLSSSGQELIYSTFLGGVEADLAYDIVIDSAGNAYVCGATESADFPEKNFGQAKSLKSALDVPETQVDAFLALYDAFGQMMFGQLWRLPGFNYYRTMVIMKYGFNPLLLLTGYRHSGVSVMAYAIRDYSEIIEVYEATPVFELDDPDHHYYPKDLYGLDEWGVFALSLQTDATIPTPDNGTADPHPDHESVVDHLVALTRPAKIEVSIAMPDSIQFGAQLVAYIQVKNVSTDVEARMVQLKIKADTSEFFTLLEKYDDPFLNEPFMLGNIAPGESIEIIACFKVGSQELQDILSTVGHGGDKLKIEAEAKGANTSTARAEKTAEGFRLDVYFSVQFLGTYLGGKKSAQIEMVDLYINDTLVADNLQIEVPQQYVVTVSGIYPKIDITSSTDTDNLNPLATYMIDLNGPGNEHLISPRDHELILIEDIEQVIHLHHKRNVQTNSSDPSKVDLYVVHGAEDIGSTDVRIVDKDNPETVLETLFDDLEPDSVTDYVTITPGVVAFELSSSDNSIIHQVVETDLTTLVGKAVSGVIVPVGTGEGASAILVISGTIIPVGISGNLSNGLDGIAYINSYPNPFSSAASIVYLLEKPMDMEFSVYNLSGQKIRILHSGFQLEGEHQIHWDGTNESGQQVDPGIYLCILKTDSGIVTHKLTRVR